MRILFQGDSITDAFRKPDEINPAFQLGNGYAFLVAAKLARAHPGRFEFLNRGVSGDTVPRLTARWQQDALDLKPDVLSLLAGVNDTATSMRGKAGEADSRFADDYRNLLATMREANPAIGLILVEPFVTDVAGCTDGWRPNLLTRQLAIAEIAREFGAVFVPVQAALDAALASAPPAYWAYDGVHLTHAGFQILADAWLDAAAPVLGIK
ncbi:MAG: GDSL-type esterase/lipase family protein [Verrucomicrobiota bacterium]